MRSLLLTWLLCCCTLFSASIFAIDNTFPHRKNFPDIAILSPAELQKNLAHTTVIDVRSRFEHNTIHITGAHWAPVAIRQFNSDLQKITRGNHNVDLVFYCNGKTCDKSYIAARQAKLQGYRKARVFDLGIMAWARQ